MVQPLHLLSRSEQLSESSAGCKQATTAWSTTSSPSLELIGQNSAPCVRPGAWHQNICGGCAHYSTASLTSWLVDNSPWLVDQLGGKEAFLKPSRPADHGSLRAEQLAFSVHFDKKNQFHPPLRLSFSSKVVVYGHCFSDVAPHNE